uniref:ORF3 protein n=2 Tax=Alphaherpesvirinae TaxID=10293 RepID=A0A1C8ET17_9ALPH|nr:orf3 protein - Marek's disease virus (strain RBIB) [Gallid alphaherpesvirus 2]AAA73123.1 unnamed protein product [Gallid alphaherpesvirus 1]AMB19009.1 ORF3 protein [Gallid alphaherpesvirus 2]
MMKRFVGQSRRSGTADHRQHRPGMSLLGRPMGVVSTPDALTADPLSISKRILRQLGTEHQVLVIASEVFVRGLAP